MNARVDRRRFLVLGATAVGGVLGLALAPSWGAAQASARRRPPAPWLTLDATGHATLTVPFTELGQGALLGIAQLVAEELDLPIASITATTAPMQARYLIKDEFYTGGSGSIQPLFEDWRRLGASARALLIEAAARRLGCAAKDCRTEAGVVVHPNGKDRLAYGLLADEAGRRELTGDVALKDRAEWRLIGTSPARPHLPTLVDGSATYGIDSREPGLLVATLAHAPQFGAHLASVDPAPALAVPGVRAVVPLGSAVAVAADTFWQASEGLRALAPVWSRPPGTPTDSTGLLARMQAALDAPGARYIPADRKADANEYRARVLGALAAAPQRHSASYEGPLLSHATLEPQNTLAIVAGGRCRLRSPTQNQSAVQREVAAALALPLESVSVETTRIGGGFGRRLKADYAVKAALVAKALGRPVQLLWSRAEDLQHDFYRPAAVARLTAGLDAQGYPTAVRAQTAASDDTIVGSLHVPWYGLGPVIVEASEVKAGLPIGAWRSVDASLACFFAESFVDELAFEAKVEPLEYRLRLAREQPRTRRVLEAVAERAGWARRGERALGIAAFAGWGTYVAQVAEVEHGANGKPKVTRITCAFDCGTAVNPRLVSAQVEGGITMGLSAALKERISIGDGRVEQSNFDGYGLLRMGECPAIDVLLLESPAEAPGGAGEPPVPAVAPALANALFRLTGSRHRRLPLAPA